MCINFKITKSYLDTYSLNTLHACMHIFSFSNLCFIHQTQPENRQSFLSSIPVTDYGNHSTVKRSLKRAKKQSMRHLAETEIIIIKKKSIFILIAIPC